MIGIRDLIVSFILMNEHGFEELMKHRVSVLTGPEVEEGVSTLRMPTEESCGGEGDKVMQW